MNKNDSIMIRVMNELLKIYLFYGCDDITIEFKKSDKMNIINLEGYIEKNSHSPTIYNSIPLYHPF